MGKKSSPPPAPDYNALAIQQGTLDKDAAAAQIIANRPNQYTPYGTTTWSHAVGTPGSFDQARYNAAMQQWQNSGQNTPGHYETQGAVGDAGGGGNVWVPGSVGTPVGNAPDSNKFMTGGTEDRWTQNTTLNPEDQKLLDQQRALQQQQQGIGVGMLDRAAGSLAQKVDYGSAPAITGYNQSSLAQVNPSSVNKNLGPQGTVDLSGQQKLDPRFGAVQQVQDAMMSRTAPLRQQQREAEIQRMRNQGLTEDSEAFQRNLARLDQGDTDAQNQALLGATSAYGDIFNRGLASNAQDYSQQMGVAGLTNQNRDTKFNQNAQVQQMLAALRGQQFGEQGAAAQLSGQQRQQYIAEQEAQRQSPINDYMKLVNGINPSMPQMPSFMGGTGYSAANLYGAGKDQYAAASDAYNAQQAQSGNMMSGLMGLGGAVLGGPATSLAGKWLSGSMREYKTNVTRVGTHDKLGIGIYSWQYLPEFAEKWGAGTHTGVMVDELVHILPEAISVDSDGHTVVDYAEVANV